MRGSKTNPLKLEKLHAQKIDRICHDFQQKLDGSRKTNLYSGMKEETKNNPKRRLQRIY